MNALEMIQAVSCVVDAGRCTSSEAILAAGVLRIHERRADVPVDLLFDDTVDLRRCAEILHMAGLPTWPET